jgi:hypothetical protein
LIIDNGEIRNSIQIDKIEQEPTRIIEQNNVEEDNLEVIDF